MSAPAPAVAAALPDRLRDVARHALASHVRGLVATGATAGIAIASRIFFKWPSLFWLPGTGALCGSVLLGGEFLIRLGLHQPDLCPDRRGRIRLRRLARTEGLLALGLAGAGILGFVGKRGTVARAVACWTATVVLVAAAYVFIKVDLLTDHFLTDRGIRRLPALLVDRRVGPATLGRVAERWSRTPFRFASRAAAWLLAERPGFVTRLTAAVLALIVWSAASTAALPILDKAAARSDQGTAPSITGPTATNPSGDTSPSKQSDSVDQPTFDKVCGAKPATQPGQDAGWAKDGLLGLYFNPGSGFGAVEAGCPEPKEEVRDGFDEVVFQRGLKSKGLRSVALVSRRYGPAMFLDDAAIVVLGYLSNGMAASGSSRIDIGNGDVQLVWTRQGTVALVRGRKVQADADRPEPLVQLPPAATTAWQQEMDRLGRWLWPSKLEPSDDGRRRFGLAEEVDGTPLADLTVDEGGAVATVGRGGTTHQVRTDPDRVTVESITSLAPPVPRR